MKKIKPLIDNKKKATVHVIICSFFTLAYFLHGINAYAQQALLPVNATASTPWVNTTPTATFNLSETHSSLDWGIPNTSGNVVDNNLTNSASTTIVVSGTSTLRVLDNSSGTSYNAGNFAGFLIRNSSLVGVSLLGAVTVTTYLNGTKKEEKTSSSLLGVSSSLISGSYEVGFYTTMAFNQIEIKLSNPLTLATTYNVYYAVQRAYGAGATLACNTQTKFVNSAFPAIIDYPNTFLSGVNIGSSTITDKENAVDNDDNTYASINLAVGLLNTGKFAVKQAPNNVTIYPAGTFAGFDIQDIKLIAGAAIGVTHKISTYLNGNEVESYTDGSLVNASFFTSTGRQVLGFKSTSPFDEVVLTVTNTLSVGTNIRIYNAVLEKFCADAELPCNTPTNLKSPRYAAYVDGTNTGVQSALACVNCDILNSGNAIDADTLNYAQVTITAGVATVSSFAVGNGYQAYPVGTFAGFDIENPVLVGANVLSGLTISTYLNGAFRESRTGNTGLLAASVPLINGTGRQIVGFASTLSFDAIKISFTQTAALNLGTTKIYSAVVQKFCTPPALTCNTVTKETNPVYPVFVDMVNTGVDALGCVGCSLNNSQFVVDSISSNYATMVLAAGVATSGQFAVKDQLTTFPAKSFAGFDIGNANLIGANLLTRVTISLLLNGVTVQTGSGTNLLVGATSSLLTGTSRQIVGIVSDTIFNEVKITLNQTADVNVGTTFIYNAVFEKLCAGTLSCNASSALIQPSFPAVINIGRTGMSGIGCAVCAVNNPWNVITADTTDFAAIKITVGAVENGSIAVQDPVSTYPIGTIAGFTIFDHNFLVDLTLFNSLTISTYNDGVLQESASGSSLLDLQLLFILIGQREGVHNVGFKTTKPFDEVRITVASFATVLDNNIDVYGAFVDTRSLPAGTPGLNCAGVSGNVFNDANGATDGLVNGAGIGLPIAAGGSTGTQLYANLLSSSNIVVQTVPVNADGTYAFPGGVTNGSYTVQISTTEGVVTATAPPTVLPVGWVNVDAAANGTATPTSGASVNTSGKQAITVSGASVTAVFGIDKIPVAGTNSLTAGNPGAFNNYTVPNGGFNPTDEDGSVASITITAFPANVTSITLNGVTYTAATWPAAGYVVVPFTGGNPTSPVLIDPTDGNKIVTLNYTATDNAGVPSGNTGSLAINFGVVTGTGVVFDDANGNSVQDSEAGSNGGGLNVILVDGNGNVVENVSVAANGSYTLTQIPKDTTGYKMIISTIAGVPGSAAPASSVPSGWIRTGENIAGNAADPNNPTNGDGSLNIPASASNLTGYNFGMERLPIAGGGSALLVDPGAENSLAIPASAFTSTTVSSDPDGTVSSIRISVFPANTTTITINGTPYTATLFATTFPNGAVVPTDAAGNPTQPILINPSNGNPIIISFTAIDNAGKESANAGTAILSFNGLTISGIVYNDANGGTIDGIGTNTIGTNILYANLLNASGNVLASVPVGADGSYIFGLTDGVQGNTTFSVAVSNGAKPLGLPPSTTLVNALNTAEGITPAGDLTPDGKVLINVTSASVVANFGIDQRPLAGSGTVNVTNPGGTNSVTIPASAFTNSTLSSDPPPGNIASILITAFPANATTITINGSTYTAGEFATTFPNGVSIPTDGNGNPTQPIAVDPSNGNPVIISFVAIDNAGKTSANTGTASINFTDLTISGIVYNDADGGTIDGTPTNIIGIDPVKNTLYANLIDPVTNFVLISRAVASDGSFSFGTADGIEANKDYKISISNGSQTVDEAPNMTLLNALNTAEGITPTGDNLPDGIAAANISNTSVSVNFGIDQRPSAGSGTFSAVNPGGTNSVVIPATAFTSTIASSDIAPGTVTAIRILSLPSGANSITIDGTIYGPGFTPFPADGIVVPANGSGRPTQAIAIDPINNTQIFIIFNAIDNAGVESANTGIVTVTFTDLTISGLIYHDANGGTINGTPTNTVGGSTIYVNLIDPTTGMVLASKPVGSGGAYSFGTADGVQANTNFEVLLSTSEQTVGTVPNSVLENENITSTAEGNTATGDGSPDGSTSSNVGTTSVIANFALDVLPTAGSGSFAATYVEGSNSITVPPSAFTNIEPSSDAAPGIVSAIRIISFPDNVSSITINGIVYGPGFISFPDEGVVVTTNASGNPTQTILVDPSDGKPVEIRFFAIDNAGKESGNIGTATLNFAPDLIPLITIVPTTQQGTTNFTAVVSVYEVNNTTTNNSAPIVVYVSKNNIVSFTFNPADTTINSATIENSKWTMDAVSNPSYYVFTTNSIIDKLSKLSFVLNGITTPNSGTGKLNISAIIFPGSGGETRGDNNLNSGTITFFP